MLSLVAAVVMTQVAPGSVATRFDLGERLKELDVAWMRVRDRTRRAQAIAPINRAVAGFFAGRTGEVALALDEAIAILEGERLRPEDAVSLRFIPALAEPGRPALLRVRWAYLPKDARPVSIRAGGRSVTLAPGRTITLEVNPWRVNPDLRLTPEVGFEVPIEVGNTQRSAYLSLIKGGRARIEALTKADDPLAKELGEQMLDALAKPDSRPQEMPYIEWLFVGEQLVEGRFRPTTVEALPYVRHRNTVFRAQFPRVRAGSPQPSVVVLAFHGAGGTEDMFFDSYGRGIALQEALKRGWAFIAPRASSTAAEDVLDWLREVRKMNPQHVLVMGHSMGGGMALSAGTLRTKPTALALFAPATSGLPEAARELPIYLAVGKQEMPQLLRVAQAIARDQAGRPKFQFQEFDPSEHLMVVADAVPEAFAFWDRVVSNASEALR